MRDKRSGARPPERGGSGRDRPQGGKKHWKGLRGPQPPRGQGGGDQAARKEDRPGFAIPTGQGEDVALLFGIHAVEAALANPARRVRKLYLTENAENRLAPAIKDRDVPAQRVQPKDLDRRLGEETVHQGVLLEAGILPEPALEELAARARAGGPLVVLDQVTDPHNVGAILRSAAVFGASGLVMTRRHSPPLTGVLAKSASGALDVVPVALVPNLARALEEIADLGVYRVGLDGDAGTLIEDADFKGAAAIVLGAEGEGLRRLTRESCDVLVRIGAPGAFKSLNVSNAAAVALHVASTQRRGRTGA